MTVLGIVLILGVSVVTATVVANGSDTAPINVVGLHIDNASVAGIYAFGALNLLLVVLGLLLVLGGARRARRRRSEVRELRRQADAPAAAPAAGHGAHDPSAAHVRHDDQSAADTAAHRRDEADDGPDGEHFRGVPRDR